MRTAFTKSVENRHNTAQLIMLIVMILLIALGLIAGLLMMQNEKLEVKATLLRAEYAELEAERDALLLELDEITRRHEDLMQLQEDISEIKDILSGAREIDATLTAYSPLDPNAVEGVCFSGDPSITASGAEVVPGVTVAAGREIPFGTRVWIEGYGMRTVQDRGGRIGPNDIDIAVADRTTAFAIGRLQARVLVLEG